MAWGPGLGGSGGRAVTTTRDQVGTELRRSLGRRQMTMLGLGSALGTGLFLGSGAAIGIAGPAVIVAYVICAVIAGIISACLAEMTARYPLRGAFGALCARFLSPFAGYVARWSYSAAAVIAVGSEVVAAATYLRFWWPGLPMWVGVAVVAGIIVAINLVGVGSFGAVEFVLSSVKVIALSLFIVFGLLLVFVGLPRLDAVGVENLTGHGGFAPHGWAAVWQSMSIVIFGFVGIELVAISAPEAKDPRGAIEAAMRTLIWRLAFFYIAAVAIVLCVVPWTDAATGGGVRSSPFVQVFGAVGIPAAAAITNFLVLVAAVSAANANLYGATRLINSLALDGMAPRILRATSGRGVPVAAVALAATGTLVAAVLTMSGVADIYVLLTSVSMFGVLVTWLLILVSYLRFRDGAPRAGFAAKLGKPAALVGIAGVLAIVATAAAVHMMTMSLVIGLLFLLMLAGVYRAAGLHNRLPAATD
ncbi:MULTISPECIES: amino acid permease [unclassified Nocardia]|uniref:amino acid permease n=1 Tax=unclassified Nocardia TaxID=2637762 RepID=UPI001CE4212B|nr:MULTISPECIES: amino acid permease [unclassified Nocardia]